MKMKFSMVVCLSLVCAVAVFAAEDTFEDVDVESILKDDAKMKLVFDCLLDRGPCGEFQKLRDMIPSMIETDCSQCSPKKKEKYELVKTMLLEKYPKDLELVIKKYSSKSD